MKILACVKQVPRLDQVRFDRANRIVRDDVEAQCNPLDTRALGHALRLRDEQGGEVVVATMGPPGAREVLVEAVQAGADRGVHLTDRRFKGADTLATARALARLIERERPDLVLFGRGTLDGATAQLGQQVAELAGLAALTEAVEISATDSAATVRRDTERGHEQWRLPLPAVITVVRGPEPPGRNHGREAGVTELTAEELGGQPTDYGTRGSPTFVKQVHSLQREPRGEHVADPAAAAERVRQLVQEARAAWLDRPAPARAARGPAERDVWVVAERDGRELDPVSLEGLACAAEIADELGARISAVLLADDGAGLIEQLATRGADRVLHVRHPALDGQPSEDALTGTLAAAVQRERPSAVLAPWSIQGRGYLPRVAARLGLGLVGDTTGLQVEAGDPPRLLWVKPAWAGTAEALVVGRTTPAMGTLRPGAFRAPDPGSGGAAEVDVLDLDLQLPSPAGQCLQRELELEPPLLDHAPVVFCLGGRMPARATERARALARQWDVGFGGTGAAVAAGRVPTQLELGILRRSIDPQLCIAMGVDDAADLDAVRGAGSLVTIHPDPSASAHQRADVAVHADAATFVEVLEHQQS